MSKKNKHDDNTSSDSMMMELSDLNNLEPGEPSSEEPITTLSDNTVMTEEQTDKQPVPTQTEASNSIDNKKDTTNMPNAKPFSNPTQARAIIAPAEKAITRPAVKDPVSKLIDMTNTYVSLVQPGVKLEENKKKAVDILTNIAQYILSSNSNDVFDAFYGFMMKQRSLMLSSQTIAANLVKYADKSKITKIELKKKKRRFN